MARNSSTAIAIRQFQSETDLIVATPEPRSVSVAVWILVGLLAAAVILTLTITIQKSVSSTTGKIVSVKPLVVLEALDPSIIKSLDVKEGDAVTQGQQLATLDATFTSADLTQMKSQVEGLKAQIARDNAELLRQPFAPEIKPGDPSFSYLKLEKDLFDKRAAQFNADVTSFDEKIKQQQVTIGKLEADVASYRQREKIALQVEGMRDTLFKSGSSSLKDLLTATDNRLEMQRTRQFDDSGLQEARHQVASLQADRESYIQKFLSDTANDLITARNGLDTAQAALDKASKHENLVSVTADAPGVVLTLAKVSVGSVLKQGDPLLSLMPADSATEAEVGISTRDIGFVRVGDNVRIKVDAFNVAEHGYAEGRVKWISADAFTTDDDGKGIDPYYKARVSIDTNHFTGVPANFRLIPGMTLAADINVGTRLLGRYIIGGALRGASEPMRDP